MRTIRREIQSFNKLQGARVMQNAWTAMHSSRISRILRRKPLVNVLVPFRGVRAQTTKSLEEKIRRVSKSKKCERVFIRGDPIKAIIGDRKRYWYTAPRGHLDMKTGEISWDAPPVEPQMALRLPKIKNYNFLLYATRPSEKIEKEGSLNMSRDAQAVTGTLEFDNRRITFYLGFKNNRPFFIGKKIEGWGKLGEHLSNFIITVIQQGDWRGATLHFVKWKGEKGVEFFDFIKEL